MGGPPVALFGLSLSSSPFTPSPSPPSLPTTHFHRFIRDSGLIFKQRYSPRLSWGPLPPEPQFHSNSSARTEACDIAGCTGHSHWADIPHGCCAETLVETRGGAGWRAAKPALPSLLGTERGGPWGSSRGERRNGTVRRRQGTLLGRPDERRDGGSECRRRQRQLGWAGPGQGNQGAWNVSTFSS